MKKISNIFFLIKRAWAIKKSMFFIYFVKLVFEAVRPYITIWFSAKILDAVSSGQSFERVLYYILWMVCGNLLFALVLNVIQVLHIDIQNKTNNRAGSQLMKDYMSIDYKYNESGDMLNLTQSFFLYVQPAEFLPLLGNLLTGSGSECLYCAFHPSAYFISPGGFYCSKVIFYKMQSSQGLSMVYRPGSI